jgi:hypothetical protein
LTAYGRFSTVPAIRASVDGSDQGESMNKELKSIHHELAWMPQGSFDSFSAGSGTRFSYQGEDKVSPNFHFRFVDHVYLQISFFWG